MVARSQVESSSTDDWDLVRVRQKTLKRQLICPHDPSVSCALIHPSPPSALPAGATVLIRRGGAPPRGETSRRSTDHAAAGEETPRTHVVVGVGRSACLNLNPKQPKRTAQANNAEAMHAEVVGAAAFSVLHLSMDIINRYQHYHMYLKLSI